MPSLPTKGAETLADFNRSVMSGTRKFNKVYPKKVTGPGSLRGKLDPDTYHRGGAGQIGKSAFGVEHDLSKGQASVPIAAAKNAIKRGKLERLIVGKPRPVGKKPKSHELGSVGRRV